MPPTDRPHHSPYQPLTTPTARMIAAGVVDSGVDSATTNGTTGGHRDYPNNRHNRAQAVNINRVDGARVNPGSTPAVRLQEAMSEQLTIRENFDPVSQTKTLGVGAEPAPWPSVRKGHQDHLHFSTQY